MDQDANPPQHNIEAERAVLGAVLHDNEALSKARESVEDHYFYHVPHQLIFRAMVEMSNADTPIDLVTLLDHLQSSGQLEITGGASCLWKLLDGAFTAGNVRHHARIVREKAMLREARGALLETLDLIDEGHGSIDDIMVRSETLFNEVIQVRSPDNSDGPRSAWEFVPEVCGFFAAFSLLIRPALLLSSDLIRATAGRKSPTPLYLLTLKAVGLCWFGAGS